MNNQIKLFIVEGEDRDNRYIKNMIQSFLKGKYESRIITLPAAQNIYMLFEKLREDQFETDIVELIREQRGSAAEQLKDIRRQDISEIYMFFDFDIQGDNLRKEADKTDPVSAISEMLDAFDNETENGKLYISYPMVEAVYDYKDGMCDAYSGCYISRDGISHYKRISGEGNPKASLRFGIYDWKMILNIFTLRLQCFFELERMEFALYREMITPLQILRKQEEEMSHRGRVFVLSGMPEFLIDYFPKSFWNSMIKSHKKQYDNCIKEC